MKLSRQEANIVGGRRKEGKYPLPGSINLKYLNALNRTILHFNINFPGILKTFHDV